MSVNKDPKRGTWMVRFKYKLRDNTQKSVTKRGFRTQEEALAWEKECKDKYSGRYDIPFALFVEVYREEVISKLKPNTAANKNNIIDTKILPYFGQMILNEITYTDVMEWRQKLEAKQNVGLGGESYSRIYLDTMHSQLSAIFNHAVKFYGLPRNPARSFNNISSSEDEASQCYAFVIKDIEENVSVEGWPDDLTQFVRPIVLQYLRNFQKKHTAKALVIEAAESTALKRPRRKKKGSEDPEELPF